MQVKTPPQNTLTAVTQLLQPYCDELSPRALIDALKQYEAQPTKDLPRYLDKHEAAQVLGVSWYTLVQHARSGTIPATKVGGQWRFRIDSIQELAEGGGSYE